MAAYSGMRIVHATLVAATVDTVTLDRDYSEVEVTNVDGVAPLYFTVDAAAPTVAGNDTEVLPGAIGRLRIPSGSGSPTVVRLISAGTPKYSVKGI